MIDAHPEMRDQRTLDVPHRLLRRDFGRRQHMDLIHRAVVARNDPRRNHTRQRRQQFLRTLDRKNATGDQAKKSAEAAAAQSFGEGTIRARTGPNVAADVPPFRRHPVARPGGDFGRTIMRLTGLLIKRGSVHEQLVFSKLSIQRPLSYP